MFLNQRGIFKRVGTGAWSSFFRTIPQPDRLGYYSDYVPRQGPGSVVPNPADGSIWILGDNPQRGNFLFRRGEGQISEGAKGDFSLCNAWMDIPNSLSSRKILGSGERLAYVIEVFGGPLPSVNALNALYQRAIQGERKVPKLVSDIFSKSGMIEGFVAAEEKGR
jgi:hypothetical protein